MEIWFWIPYPTPSLNQMLKDSWRRHGKRQWQRLAAQSLQYENRQVMLAHRQHFPLERLRITLIRYQRGNPLDPDNAVASAKPLLDVLQPVSEQNRYGLGIIAGDDPKVLTKLVVNCHRIRPGERRGTEIVLYAEQLRDPVP